ncbi:Neural proliferation differentiation and control protein 1 [Bagarius yarrelli]|uniref:Neural proliferation differentiation and control protein 1 n=1 Tax=Bagarius yarrelli TaxID=175774 RepID=A0A556V647_BAGYA|nr:Neural proliferation differentiation and control protein 1 [Bagarius yarrelli]
MPSSKREEERRLWAALLLLTTITISTTMAAVGQCPRSLDCARKGRHFCQPGSSHCGPCLSPLIENIKGKCVVRRRNHIKEVDMRPELDEEIDFLSSIISKHRESEMKHTAPSQAAPHLKDDSTRPRSHHRLESTPSYGEEEQPVTHTLTTLSTTISTSATSSDSITISPLISVMQGAPLIVPYPSEDSSYIDRRDGGKEPSVRRLHPSSPPRPTKKLQLNLDDDINDLFIVLHRDQIPSVIHPEDIIKKEKMEDCMDLTSQGRSRVTPGDWMVCTVKVFALCCWFSGKLPTVARPIMNLYICPSSLRSPVEQISIQTAAVS